MARVLISFLGTGSKDDNRCYRTANYRFEDGKEYTSPFVAKVLVNHYKIDKIILIGTVKSMWEEVYSQFARDKEIEDSNISLEIAETCDNANARSELFLPHKKDIEDVLGADSKVVLIKYGLNNDEIEFNKSIILGVEKYLNDNDELFVDITHSFRSLPLMLMNTLIYLKEVSSKKITIKHITYGMLDVIGELHYVPIIDLKSLMRTNEWITAAYSFSKLGSTYKISELIEEKDKGVATILRNFSDDINLNHLSAIQAEAQRLSGIKDVDIGDEANMIVRPILNNFISKFKNCKGSLFQLRLAEWQYLHMNYCASYISLTESIITYVCEINGMEPTDEKSNRDKAKSVFTSKNPYNLKCPIELTCWNEVNKNRISVAHSIGSQDSVPKMVTDLKKYITTVKTIIK